jgi:uncharacterized protein YlzI (FlbEa/FlbD family)
MKIFSCTTIEGQKVLINAASIMAIHVETDQTNTLILHGGYSVRVGEPVHESWRPESE